MTLPGSVVRAIILAIKSQNGGQDIVHVNLNQVAKLRDCALSSFKYVYNLFFIFPIVVNR